MASGTFTEGKHRDFSFGNGKVDFCWAEYTPGGGKASRSHWEVTRKPKSDTDVRVKFKGGEDDKVKIQLTIYTGSKPNILTATIDK